MRIRILAKIRISSVWFGYRLGFGVLLVVFLDAKVTEPVWRDFRNTRGCQTGVSLSGTRKVEYPFYPQESMRTPASFSNWLRDAARRGKTNGYIKERKVCPSRLHRETSSNPPGNGGRNSTAKRRIILFVRHIIVKTDQIRLEKTRIRPQKTVAQ